MTSTHNTIQLNATGNTCSGCTCTRPHPPAVWEAEPPGPHRAEASRRRLSCSLATWSEGGALEGARPQPVDHLRPPPRLLSAPLWVRRAAVAVVACSRSGGTRWCSFYQLQRSYCRWSESWHRYQQRVSPWWWLPWKQPGRRKAGERGTGKTSLLKL